jgi:hypothetical protein
VEERHTGLAEERHKAAVGDSLVGAAVGHMGAGHNPAAEVEHNRPVVEELRSHPAEVGSLLEAGIPGSALVEVGRMAAVAGMESLMVGGTGRNRAERILVSQLSVQLPRGGVMRLGIELEVDKVVLTALVRGVAALLSWGRIIRHVEKIRGSESWETVRLE